MDLQDSAPPEPPSEPDPLAAAAAAETPDAEIAETEAPVTETSATEAGKEEQQPASETPLPPMTVCSQLGNAAAATFPFSFQCVV